MAPPSWIQTEPAFRIQTEPGTEPVVSVDGAFDAPGLNLSHWPGHRTPGELRRDLSTEVALDFVALAPERQAELAKGCTTIVNNHYDTDGVCSAFALLQPEVALAHRDALLAAAAAGDLFRVPSEDAFCLDVVVAAFADPERSPIAAQLANAERSQRYERASLAVFERLPALLEDGGLAPYEGLWAEPLAQLRSDQQRLATAAFDELVHLDAGVYLAPTGGELGPFDPGRHALFGATELDRLLVLGQAPEGCTARLIFNTTSWFDMTSRRPQARPDLDALVAELNGLEGCAGDGAERWRTQPADSPAPELWFGREIAGLYLEHGAAHLGTSGLDPLTVKARVLDALRNCWTFSDDEDDEEGDWRLV